MNDELTGTGVDIGTSIRNYEDHRALLRWRTQREEGSEGP